MEALRCRELTNASSVWMAEDATLVLRAVARRPTRRVLGEPAIPSLLSLTCEVERERATGIEPAFSAWEAFSDRLAGQAECRNSLVRL
jgi:murein endopeptidase